MAITTSCARTPVPTIVLECYRSMLGYPAAPSVRLQMAKQLEIADPSLLCAALEYTAEHAPRPTWAYAKAVIDRQIILGSKTAADFNRACAAFRDRPGYRPGYYQKNLPTLQELTQHFRDGILSEDTYHEFVMHHIYS